MNEKKAFCIYYSLNLHFKNEKFSVLRYGTNTKHVLAKYETLTQNQRFRFSWLGKKFVNPEDLVFACIGCFFDTVNIQFGNVDEITKSYYNFKRRRESLSYVLTSEHNQRGTQNVNFEQLLYQFLGGKCPPEYILLNDIGLTQLKNFYQDANFAFCRDRILLLMKYSAFFNHQKYIHIIKENHEHQEEISQ